MPGKNKQTNSDACETATAEVQVNNARGLHLRFAGLIAREAFQYKSRIAIWKGRRSVDARSMVEMGTLSASNGSHLKISAVGEDATAAVGALVHLFQTYHEED
ncbi:MAG: HPr family phosphocarrier protein [Victivallales bacterium]|nr:HPr family phosphocarrier protein [Victivallales bacterium]